MFITLTPEIEQTLNKFANQQGTTIELLVLSAIREKFFPQQLWAHEKPQKREFETLIERLAPYIGTISSSECVPGGANMSVDSGKKFGSAWQLPMITHAEQLHILNLMPTEYEPGASETLSKIIEEARINVVTLEM